MAASSSSAVLHCSSSLAFRGRVSVTPVRLSTWLPPAIPRNRSGLVVRASSNIVLVEKSEAEKANRLKTFYLEKVVPLLTEEFSYENVHEVPKVEKIVVNCGI